MTTISIEEGGKLYRIHEKGEWARIFVKGWENSGAYDDHKNYGVMVLIHSGYGNYAYSWTSCATSYDKFLPSLNFDYLMGKLDSKLLREFDCEATKAYLITLLISCRRDDALSKKAARKAYQHIVSINSHSGEEFMHEWRDCSSETSNALHTVSEEPYEFFIYRPSYQATGFFERIWKPLMSFIATESVQSIAPC